MDVDRTEGVFYSAKFMKKILAVCKLNFRENRSDCDNSEIRNKECDQRCIMEDNAFFHKIMKDEA